ncbi:MAG: hypothetical protein ACEY3F_05440, partial [Wolbachia sp.]
MAKYSIRCKTVIDEQVIELVNYFSFLGCDISYKTENDVTNKLHKFQTIRGTIHRTLGNKTRKDTRIKFYKLMAVLVLTYDSETCITTRRDEQRIQTSEMKFLRRTTGCSIRDQIRNEYTRDELNIYF